MGVSITWIREVRLIDNESMSQDISDIYPDFLIIHPIPVPIYEYTTSADLAEALTFYVSFLPLIAVTSHYLLPLSPPSRRSSIGTDIHEPIKVNCESWQAWRSFVHTH